MNGHLFDDLIQEGRFGLLRAVERYSGHRGRSFFTYAAYWICQRIDRARRNDYWAVRVLESRQSELREIEPLVGRLRQELGAEPTMVDLAEAAGMSLEETNQCLRDLAHLHAPVSLDSRRDRVAHPELRRLVAPPEDDPAMDDENREQLRSRLNEALEQLESRQRDIVTRRFGLDGGGGATLQEIGDGYGVSRERIRQLEEKALCKLKRLLSFHSEDAMPGEPPHDNDRPGLIPAARATAQDNPAVRHREPTRSSARRAATRRRIGLRRPIAVKLAQFYKRNGYVLQPDLERRDQQGTDAYRNGVEVRLMAKSKRELAEIRRLLKAAGFEPGRPFAKGRQFRLPLYGAEQAARFFDFIEGHS